MFTFQPSPRQFQLQGPFICSALDAPHIGDLSFLRHRLGWQSQRALLKHECLKVYLKVRSSIPLTCGTLTVTAERAGHDRIILPSQKMSTNQQQGVLPADCVGILLVSSQTSTFLYS